MADAPHVEPRLASDPKDPRRLLIGAMLFRRDGGGDSECTALASSDGGRTWRRGTLPKLEGVTGGGDPWVGFDHSGTAFLSCLHGVRTPAGERTSGVGVYRSTDGGASWTGPAMIPGRAQRWTPPMRLADLAPGERQQHVPTVAADGSGTVATMWVDYRDDPRGECSELYFRASLDAASTWMAAVPLSSKPSCPRSASNTIMRLDGKPYRIDRRWAEGGDYHGLIGAGRGTFHAVWSDSSTGVFQIHFATIDVSGVRPAAKGQ
jgi:hypothetical protein